MLGPSSVFTRALSLLALLGMPSEPPHATGTFSHVADIRRIGISSLTVALPNWGFLLPDGMEQPLNSSGKSPISSSGAAESAALDAELATVFAAWPFLSAHTRSVIMAIVKATKIELG
jgi:hypothetical protein